VALDDDKVLDVMDRIGRKHDGSACIVLAGDIGLDIVCLSRTDPVESAIEDLDTVFVAASSDMRMLVEFLRIGGRLCAGETRLRATHAKAPR
jgi:hypothetical protein